MLAVIKTGGKQYSVKEGDTLKVEKLLGEAGDKVTFDEVLMTGDDKSVVLGTPVLKGVTVEGDVIDQAKADKVTGVKHKAKKRYKMKFGHRQPFTEVKITKIGK